MFGIEVENLKRKSSFRIRYLFLSFHKYNESYDEIREVCEINIHYIP